MTDDEKHSAIGRDANDGFWPTFFRVAVRPQSALAHLAHNRNALKKALTALAIILGAYTGILAVLIAKDSPAAAPAVLPITVEQQYPVQIWYQGPLFLLTTLATAGFLVITSHVLGGSTDYVLSFTRLSFASTIPFFFTTMLVEAVTALALLMGIIQPESTQAWLKGAGAGFAAAYQAAGAIWIVVLFVIVARQTTGRSWLASAPLGIATAVVYAIPVALFIR